MLRNFRRTSQAFFLLVFFWLFLQTESKGADELGYPVKVFLDADPLLWLSTTLATRSFDHFLSLALFVAIATVLLGRVFCGWVCPLGAMNDLAGRFASRRSAPLGWFHLKYMVLFSLLAASLFTFQPAGLLDPLSLTIRSLALSLYPACSRVISALFDGIYTAHLPVLTDASEAVYGFLRRAVLPFRPPMFRQAFLLGLLFCGIVALNLVERRFWCRYLCPLGALLGLLSRHALLRRSVSEGCSNCGACTSACRGGGAGAEQGWKASECLACMECDDLCREEAVHFGFASGKTLTLDLGRRHLVASLTAGVAAASLVRISPLSRPGAADPALIRPPGAIPEPDFVRRCVKCGECMKVCLTGGLQPALWAAGIEGVWTPVLVPRIGYCEYHCTLCGQVCPTGAIRKLIPQEKVEVRIGLAMVDPGRCLPYGHGIPCIVCQEVCPTPKKAIWLEQGMAVTREGRRIFLKRPRVDLELCIGCGICETKCPVLGRPAITVASAGETRSLENRLLLP